jgi:hypothetical protein
VDLIGFEEACATKLSRELGMSTFLQVSLGRLSPGGQNAAVLCSVQAGDIERECAPDVDSFAGTQEEAQLEREVYDAQSLTYLLSIVSLMRRR